MQEREIKKEIVRFYEDGLYDFKSYILPNVFEQLVLSKDMDDQMLICAGALADDRPVGAIIAQILEDNEIFIHSIAVETGYQRLGIGTDLINGVLSDSFEIITAENSIAAFPTRIFIHADYAFSAGDVAEFEAFLKSFGFSDYYEMDNCFYIESEKLNIGDYDDVEVQSFTKVADEYADDVFQLMYSQGVNVNTDNAFLIADGDDVKAVISAEYGMDDEYYVRSFSRDNMDISETEFGALFGALCKALKSESESFVLVADGYENINKEQLKSIARECGEIYIHKEAGCYAEFNPVEE